MSRRFSSMRLIRRNAAADGFNLDSAADRRYSLGITKARTDQ